MAQVRSGKGGGQQVISERKKGREGGRQHVNRSSRGGLRGHLAPEVHWPSSGYPKSGKSTASTCHSLGRLALETALGKFPYPLPTRSLPEPPSLAPSGAAPGSLIPHIQTAAHFCLRHSDKAGVLGWAAASICFLTGVPELCSCVLLLAILCAFKRASVLGPSSCSLARTRAYTEMANNKNTVSF